MNPGFDINTLAGCSSVSDGNNLPGPYHLQQGQLMGPMTGQAFNLNTNALNSWASSVNLSSIQSLIDLLLELPLPSEISNHSGRHQILITASQQQQHVSNNIEQELVQQHHLSHQLSSGLLQARHQLQELSLNWINNPVNETGQDFSHHHQVNSYLLSLLQRQDIFGEDVKLPPVTHQTPSSLSSNTLINPHQESLLPPPTLQTSSTSTSGPQTRSHSSQPYWNPFINEQQSAPSPASSYQNQQQYNRYPNQVYSNDNSNSSSSFSETGSAAPVTPSATQFYQTPAKVKNQQYHNSANTKPVQPSPIQENTDVNNFTHSPNSLEAFSSLGERVKKRQRNCMSSGTTPPKTTPTVSTPVQNEKPPPQDEYTSPPPKKASKSSHVKSNQSSSTTTSASATASSFSPRLISSQSTAPPPEKFEAMLDELFDLNKGKKSSLEDESEDSDSDEVGSRKKSNKKTNGETSDRKHVLFDITLSSSTLNNFICLAVKLKRTNSMQFISASKLINLLTVLTQQLAIQSVSLKDIRRKSFEGSECNEEEEEEDSYINSSTLVSKFEMCCDCCLLSLCILTSKGMSSRVYLEECIEQIIAFLNDTIQQYTTIGRAPSSSSLSPSKKGGKSPKKLNNTYLSPSSKANKKILLKMYVKWSELIGYLVELLNVRSGTLTDTLVLSATRVALGAFFLENLATSGNSSNPQCSNEIQLNALKMTTAIFSQYNNHRTMILEEILHSIARISTCKRGRVVYKVEGDDKSSSSISMLSALLLQLIQSLFSSTFQDKKEKEKLNKITDTDSKDLKDGKSTEKCKDKQEKCQILKKQYDAALLIAYSFLSTFLKKCCGVSVGSAPNSSSDSDYRILFENLVNDLMTTLHKPNWPASQLLTKVLIKLFITNIKTTAKQHGKGSSGSASSQLNMKLASLDHLGTICSRFAKELSSIDKVKDGVKTRLKNLLLGKNVSLTSENDSKRLDSDDDEEEDGDDDDETDVSDNRHSDSDETDISDIDDVDDIKSRIKSKKRKKFKKKRLNKKKEKNKVDGEGDSKENDELAENEVLMQEIWKHLLRYCDEEKLIEEKNLFSSIWLKELEREYEPNPQKEDTDDANQEDKRNMKEVYLSKVKKFMHLFKTASSINASVDEEYHVIDSKTSEQIIRYIDISFSTTFKLFDLALAHIINTLTATNNTTMRSRAMKSLSTILNNAPKNYAVSLLSRHDVQRATRAALLDASTSVREATIDLIGKFILNGQSEDLIEKYHDIITERILDTGVSVRKRVIKILRDICLTYPSYKRVPEICSKIIKRINDDGEGIRKLVTETFTQMWFKDEKSKEVANMKVKCINHVVATVITERIGTEWLQQLLTNLFNPNSENKLKKSHEDHDDDNDIRITDSQLQQVISASAQIVDVLVSDVLCGSSPNSDDSNSQQSLDNNSKSICFATMTTIWLFSKVCPQLLVHHISILQPYLSVRITSELDSLILIKAVQTIENVLPKLNNPSETLLTNIEEGLTKNILQSNPQVLMVCVSCLSSLIHKHTNNKQLAQDLFKKFFSLLDSLVKLSPISSNQHSNRPRLLRALFTCGLFAKHFEFLEEKNQLYKLFVIFVNQNRPSDDNGYKIGDLAILLKALSGLGFMFERNPSFTLNYETQSIYKTILGAALDVSSHKELEDYQEQTMIHVLKNLTNYLSDELNQEISSTFDWSKENLKTMSSDETEEGDSNSIQSSIVQTYLSDIVKCTLCPLVTVRRASVNLIHIIHQGGIVHPLQLVPYLIAMSSDDDINIRSRADHVLHEIERKYHGFVSMKAKQGVQLSFQLHSHSGRRGYRIENIMQSTSVSNSSNPGAPVSIVHEDQLITGRLATLYSVVSSNRQSRRAFISGLLKYFDLMCYTHSLAPAYDSMGHGSLLNLFGDDEVNLGPIQQFISDNIVWLPYSVLDEPLYILHQLDIVISLTASQTQSQFKEILNLKDDYDDEDEESYAKKNEKDQQPESHRLEVKSEPNFVPTSNEIKFEAPLDMDQFLVQSNLDQSQFGNLGDIKSDNRLSQTNGDKIEPVFKEISCQSIAELIKTLSAFYMLCWCKQLIRELFSITDAKYQDYSPSENQKTWDKQMHRKHVDVKCLEKLMNYPSVNISVTDVYNREAIRSEYQRFKGCQLTGIDETIPSVVQLMKEPPPKSSKEKEVKSNLSFNSSASYERNNMVLSDMSKEEKDKLIEKIKLSDCQVNLIDISTVNSNQSARNSSEGPSPYNTESRTGLKLTISTSSLNSSGYDKCYKSPSKKKKKKAKKSSFSKD